VYATENTGSSKISSLQIRMSFVVGQPAVTVSECRYRRLRPCDLNLSPTFPSFDVRYQSVDLGGLRTMCAPKDQGKSQESQRQQLRAGRACLSGDTLGLSISISPKDSFAQYVTSKANVVELPDSP
jgi:hypothetical protein